MPKVPEYSNMQVADSGQPNVQVQAPSGPTAGVIGADQQGRMGQALMGAGDAVGKIVADIQSEANITVAKDVDAQTTTAMSDAVHNPQTGYVAKLGKDSIEGYEATIENLQKIQRDALAQVTNPTVRKMVEPVINHRMQNAMDAVNRHAGQESRRYQIQTADSHALVNLRDAAQNFTDDTGFAQAVGVSRGAAQSLAKLQGWDADTERLQAEKYKDLGFKMRYEAWVNRDPVAAFSHFQKNQEQISPLVREQIGQQLFQAAAPVLATQFNNSGGVGVVSAAPTAGGELPRGIRNNNPGNITKTATPWQGEVMGNDPRYASFASPEAGIRAMGKTLLTYQDKHGINTVEGVISRWAPATENDTAAYAATVAKALGVAPGAPIDLHDSDTLTRMAKAMIQVENGPGAGRITDQQIALGLAAATKGTALPSGPSQPDAPQSTSTGSAMLDSLPDNWRLHVVQLARAQANQGMAEARENLRGKVQDATSAYMANGYAPSPPNEAEFIKAYGQAEGVSKYRDFQNVATLGQTLQHVKTLPDTALSNLVNSSKPTPGDGFAVRQQSYETLTRAVEQVRQARSQDPVGYALSTNSYGIKPLQNVTDPKALAAELTRRAAAAPQMAADYGTPVQLLTKPETQALSAMLKAAPVETQKNHIATIYSGTGSMTLFKQVMQTLAPDNPTLAVAGIYQARGLHTTQNRDVADLILRGQAILTPNTKEDGTGHMGGRALLKMPEEKLLLSDWNSATGDAFKGKEQAADLFMQTAKAIYAARSAEDGDYSGVIDSSRWRTAINMATGGIESHNGAKIVMPYGWGYDQFQNALKSSTEKIANEGGAVNTTGREMMRLPLENIGDGRYLFRRGTGYLVNKDGRPVTVNLLGGQP